MQFETVNFGGETLHLMPEKCLYWPDRDALILSDLHLGKVSHFRRHGIPLPEEPSFNNFIRLRSILAKVAPQCVYFLGDLFHSHQNQEVAAFSEFLANYPDTHFTLVKGNHDILPRYLYQNLRLAVEPEPHQLGPLIFRHHPLKQPKEGFQIAGHLHPGVSLTGPGRQRLKLPCFHVTPHQLILPAFGEFTGLAVQKPKPEDSVYVIAEKEVILL